MTIISPLPFTLVNGTVADASKVLADLQHIVDQVNANAGGGGGGADSADDSVSGGGATQGTATLLTATMNIVTANNTLGGGVLLPSATDAKTITILAQSTISENLVIFADGTELITVATDAGVGTNPAGTSASITLGKGNAVAFTPMGSGYLVTTTSVTTNIPDGN